MQHRVERLVLANFCVAFATFAVASILGAWQMLERSPLPAPFRLPEVYFASVTLHGVSMAYVLTIFFAAGFGYFVAVTTLDRPLPGRWAAWAGFWISLVGVVVTVIPILMNRASVLFTFYPPLTASLYFYLGLILVVVGSWIWAVLMIWAMAGWKRENPGRPVPLAMYATVANAILWLWTTAGVAVELLFQVVPSALGLSPTIDVGLARTLFSWTLHPIVYFWLIPAYIGFYTLLPRAAGGRLYSDTMARFSFALLVVYSLPVGMHQLFMDPEHGVGFKYLQMSLTVLVTVPTLLTIFTITASLEIAGRVAGGTGLFGWIRKLPWRNPTMLAGGLSFVMLGLGGFGGTVNMSYAMNTLVHNTTWVTAHFHLIFGGSVVIMYFAIANELWPKLVGRQARSFGPLRLQLWLWFIGMMVMSLPWHALGLAGQPRRVATYDYSDPAVVAWGNWTIVSVIGGFIMLAGALLFVWNLATLYNGAPVAERGFRYARAVHEPHRLPATLNGFALWNTVIALLMLVAYAYPIAEFFIIDSKPALVHRVEAGR